MNNNNNAPASSIPPVILYPPVATAPAYQQQPMASLPVDTKQQQPVLQATSASNPVSTIDPTAENVRYVWKYF